MSYQSTTLAPCPIWQDELNRYFQTCGSSSLMEPQPLLSFLSGNRENRLLDARVTPGNGKIRNVELRYFQRHTTDLVLSNQPNPNCDATDKYGDCTETYILDEDENEQFSELIEIKDLARVCRDNPTYIGERIAMAINVLTRKVNQKTWGELALLLGGWDAETKDSFTVVGDKLQLPTLVGGELAPFSFADLKIAMQQTGFCGPSLVLGATEWLQYAMRVDKGCCADQGVDLGELNRGITFGYDREAANALGGQDQAVVLQGGALQLVDYAFNESFNGVGQYVGSAVDANYQTIMDPVHGLTFDVNTKISDCGSFHMVFTATTKLFGLPDDIYSESDPKFGVKLVAGLESVTS